MSTQAAIKNGMLRHAVILCHPDPKSFNRAVADRYESAVRVMGHDVIVRDLYAMGFDPVLKAHERPTEAGFEFSKDVRDEVALLSGCDVFVLVYPIWFGTPPAMLKGYVERVLGSGINPKDVQERAAKPFLGGKRLVSITTSATSEPWLNEQGQWQSLRYIFDHYLTHAFGMKGNEHLHFGDVTQGMPRLWGDRHLYEVEQQARHTCATILADQHEVAAQAAVRSAPATA